MTMADVAETIEVSGRRAGHHAWIEMRLFETVGRWVGAVADPRAKALLAAQSHHHAWHAELWYSLLPALPHLPAADLVAPGDGDSALVARLAALDEAEPAEPRPARPGGTGVPGGTSGDRARLAAVYEDALPHLAATYREHLDATNPLTDGPAIRALRLAQADIADDTRAGLDLIALLAGARAGRR
jgi:hypothetical protein